MAADKKLTELTQREIAQTTDLIYLVSPDDSEVMTSYSISADKFLSSSAVGVNRIISGYVAWTGTGYIFEAVKLTYEINNVIYFIDGDQVTLAAPDGSNPRLDNLFVDESGLDAKQGTPAGSPAVPSLDNPESEISTNIVLVQNGTTEPPEISLDVVYDENTQEVGGEWDTSESTTGARIDLANTANPIHLTKDILTTDAEAGDYFEFTHTTPITIESFVSIRQTFRSLGSWKKDYVKIDFYDGATLVGSAIIDSADFPTKNTVTEYIVHKDTWSVAWFEGETQFDTIQYLMKGHVGEALDCQFHIDEIKIEYGGTNTPTEDKITTANKVVTNADNFSGNLSSDDDNVQKALETIDSMSIGGGSGDMVLADTQTVTGAKTFNDAKMLLRNVANTFSSWFTNVNTAARTYTLQNKTGTIAHLDDIQDEVWIIAFSDETTALEAGTNKAEFQMPNYATTLTGIAVTLGTAPTTSALTVDVNEGGTSVLSTKITVDATEKTSETAATPPVISDSSLAANAVITVDVDTLDSGGTSAGGKLIMYWKKA